MTTRYDIVVVGGGGAALRAALAAQEYNPNLHIALVTKGALGASGVTATACSDRMAFHATLAHTEPGGADNWHYHADDIYRIGGYVSDGDLALTLARDAEYAFRYLEQAGVPWVHRGDGMVDQFVTDGSRYARACYTGPYTANHIEQALLHRLANTSIRVFEHTMAAEVLQDSASGAVNGLLTVSELTGELIPIACRAIVLATGGAGQVFATNVYPADCTGDGYALAYRAGAELVNLEFIQIGLCSVRTNLACSGSMMRSLPRLVNDRGAEFMAEYMPGASTTARLQTFFAKGASWPVSLNEPSHIIDIAVSREKQAGRKVYLDYSTNPQGFLQSMLDASWQSILRTMKGAEDQDWSAATTPLERLQAINLPAIRWLKERGIDLVNGDLLEIAPAAQHFQGGVKINVRAETTVPGLYAAGETAGGQHGANRPGGNALLDCQVFGRIAGESAARYCESGRTAPIAVKYAAKVFKVEGALPEDIRPRIQRLMDARCSVCRTMQDLQLALEELREMRRAGIRNDGNSVPALETLNILTTAELVVSAALARDESRGPHLRFTNADALEPQPMQESAGRRYIVLQRGDAGPVIERRTPVKLTLPGGHDTI